MTLWSGRFKGKLDPTAWTLNASLPFDRRLAKQDVDGSMAWAAALQRVDVITKAECDQILKGLRAVASEFERGEFAFVDSDEDIHTAVERRLRELVGPLLAGKLHTGRSRNDQVATDFRRWILEAMPMLDSAIAQLQATLLARAEADQSALMPGYTHLQRAQPILLSHWWLSHFWPLQRDRERLADARDRVSVMPLGSGALAGTPFPIDRAALAEALSFATASPNSMDAVADRDFAVEFLFDIALAGVHLSRLAEVIVLFTTAEFGFFELSDSFSTGSSLMPQKKNPDIFELTRGKAGSLIGLLGGLLTTLKGLPSTYDKDLQEDKVPIFQATDTLFALLPVLAGALNTMTVHPERMRAAVDPGMMATDLADHLVTKGIPFREAHTIIGKAIQLASERGVHLDGLALHEWQSLGPFEADVYEIFDPIKSISKRNALGGTAPLSVQKQIEQAKAALTISFHEFQRRKP